jgi:hypothetical protein
MIFLRVVCLSVMAASLLLEGAILAFSGFPWLSAHRYINVIGFVWVVTDISLVLGAIIKRPMLAVVASCTLFLVSAVTGWFYSSEEKTLVWFLYQHSLELCTIAAALVLYCASRTRKTHELL